MIKQAYSFKNAIEGFIWIIKTQRNFKIHLCLSLLAILGGIILNISEVEFMIIFAFIFIGLSIESVNTAIEETIDALHKDYSPQIKIAKDTSAAAMLLFSLGAFIIACIIFIPKLLYLLLI